MKNNKTKYNSKLSMYAMLLVGLILLSFVRNQIYSDAKIYAIKGKAKINKSRSYSVENEYYDMGKWFFDSTLNSKTQIYLDKNGNFTRRDMQYGFSSDFDTRDKYGMTTIFKKNQKYRYDSKGNIYEQSYTEYLNDRLFVEKTYDTLQILKSEFYFYLDKNYHLTKLKEYLYSEYTEFDSVEVTYIRNKDGLLLKLISENLKTNKSDTTQFKHLKFDRFGNPIHTRVFKNGVPEYIYSSNIEYYE